MGQQKRLIYGQRKAEKEKKAKPQNKKQTGHLKITFLMWHQGQEHRIIEK
jgi:hypothetical protein